jgi:hypothetical protein
MPQRSPLIFWLLLAATLSVDVVVFSQMASKTFPGRTHLVVVLSALILSQLSVVCIWSAFRSTKNVWTRLVPYVTALVAAVLTAMFIDDPVEFGVAFKTMLTYYGFHAVLLIIALWLLQRTAFWRRRSGTTHTLQFSIVHLLIAMTVVAVLTTLMRDSPLFGENGWTNLGVAIASVVLAVASVVIWSLSIHWLLRLASVVGIVGCLFVAIFLSTGFGPEFPLLFGGYYLIQALVLSTWLGLGPILPINEAALSANASRK